MQIHLQILLNTNVYKYRYIEIISNTSSNIYSRNAIQVYPAPTDIVFSRLTLHA